MCIDAPSGVKLRKKLIKLWEKELYSERNIFLLIKNIPSHSRAEEVRLIFETDHQRRNLGIDLIALKGHLPRNIALTYRGWADHLLNEIQMSYFKNKYFDVAFENMTANKLVIQMK